MINPEAGSRRASACTSLVSIGALESWPPLPVVSDWRAETWLFNQAQKKISAINSPNHTLLLIMALATLVDLLVARSSIARAPKTTKKPDANAEQARS